MSNATVLVVEDDRPLQDALVATLEGAGYGVLSAGDGIEALHLLEDWDVDLVLSDVQMKPMNGRKLLRQLTTARPQLPVLLMTAFGTIDEAVSAMREGAVDYLVKPFHASELTARVAQYVPEAVTADGFIAEDARSLQLLALADRVADSDVTVLISGESGTGKEVLARYIHRRSQRCEQPFVAINCAAIPDNMLEAVLFGYEKGAFTGAYKRTAGKFIQAEGGTLLLDEISEMDLGLQAKLLRVLQEKEVEPLGAGQAVPFDVRVLATTNRDLRAQVREGAFREDLYYRLHVFPMLIAPLRDRPADILPLTRFFIDEAWGKPQPTPVPSPQAEARLKAYHWPGNVRELSNVVQRALVLTQSNVLDADVLDLGGPGQALCADNGLGDELKTQESRLIIQALKDGNGSRKYAAERLGISPRTLRYKLARLREQGLEIPRCA